MKRYVLTVVAQKVQVKQPQAVLYSFSFKNSFYGKI